MQHQFVSYCSQAAQLEITHMCMPGCFISFRSVAVAFLARMEVQQQLKGALAENKRSCRLPPIWTRQCLCEYGSEGPPINGLPGGGGDGGCAGVSYTLDTLRTRAGQVGGFAAPFLGPLGGTETEAGKSGATLFGCQMALFWGPKPFPHQGLIPCVWVQVPLPPCLAPMAGDSVLADFSMFETEAWEQRQEGVVTNMLYSPKCPRGCVVAKGYWKGEHPAHMHRRWSNHLTALLSQLPNYRWKENTMELRQADPEGQPQLWAWLFHLSHAAWLWFAAPTWQRSFHGIGAGLRSWHSRLAQFMNYSLVLSRCNRTLEFEVVRPKRRKMRYAEASLLGLCLWKRHSCLQVDNEMQQHEGPQVWSKKCRLFWAREPVPCPLLHAYCWKKVWLSEVPCQQTTGSQHVRACLIGLQTTSNTAREVFGPFPVDYVTASLFYHNGKHFCVQNQVFTTMAAFLRFCFLENIILSPTDVSQEPCHSGVVSASSCSWLFLVSMFPLGGKWHKLPPPFLVGFPVIHLAWLEVQLCATIVAMS